MPVYTQTYRHYTGEWRSRALAWTVIAANGIKKRWRNKGFRLILFLAGAMFLASAARLYLAANLDLIEFFEIPTRRISEILAINDQFYYQYLEAQQFWCFFTALICGAGAISTDRKTKALILYLSKPITRFDYVFGKAAHVAFYQYIITMGSAFALMLLNAIFTENWMSLFNLPLILRIFAYSNVVVLPLTILSLTLSALIRSREMCAALFAALFWLPSVIIQSFRGLLGRWLWGSSDPEWWSLCSLPNLWDQLGSAIFGQPLPFAPHWIYHLAVLALFCAAMAFVLHQRIEAVEVVG